jgi:diaminopimelate epimerase
MKLYKYSGAGNDFVVLDGREGIADEWRQPEQISRLCDRHTGFRAADGRVGADGIMILNPSAELDFSMEFYNPDGTGGMMCGNGGRCIVAFADFLGIQPAETGRYIFEAADGIHSGKVLRRLGDYSIVRLKMSDVHGITETHGGYFLNTGTRHFVRFVPDVEAVDVDGEGRKLRWDPAFAPEGTNVNFVSVGGDGKLHVRTFEKGVEAETLACGTGITASAIAAYVHGLAPAASDSTGNVTYVMRSRMDDLSVDFVPAGPADNVYLTGPAALIR